MFDYSVQTAAEYDRFAPTCPGCGKRMMYLARLGGRIIWECECGNQVKETPAEYRRRRRRRCSDF